MFCYRYNQGAPLIVMFILYMLVPLLLARFSGFFFFHFIRFVFTWCLSSLSYCIHTRQQSHIFVTMVRVMCDMCNNVCINKIPNSFAIKSRNEHHKRYAYLFQIYNIFICILYERTHILLHTHYTLHTTYTPRKHEIRFEIATLVPIYILIEVKIETKHQKRDKIIIVYYDVSVIL